MRKLLLYISMLCCFTSCYGMTTKTRKDGTLALRCDKSSVTDDDTAAMIGNFFHKKLRPYSVSEIIDQIKKQDTKSVTKLSLEQNNFRLSGAILLLNYIADSLENLRVLNLANNSNFNRNKNLRKTFRDSLIRVLKMDSVKKVDLTGCFESEQYEALLKKNPKPLRSKLTYEYDKTEGNYESESSSSESSDSD
jgi:hypothetical protein